MLWAMQYQQRYESVSTGPASNSAIIMLDSLSSELALDEDVLQDVKAAWKQICGTGADPDSFLKFEARDGAVDEE